MNEPKKTKTAAPYMVLREVKQPNLPDCWGMIGRYETMAEAELSLARRKKLRPQIRYKIEVEK